MLGVEKTLEVIEDLKSLSVNAIELVKSAQRGPLAWPAIFAGVIRVGADVKELVEDAPDALPELKDINSADEVVQITAASYECVKAIVAALAA